MLFRKGNIRSSWYIYLVESFIVRCAHGSLILNEISLVRCKSRVFLHRIVQQRKQADRSRLSRRGRGLAWSWMTKYAGARARAYILFTFGVFRALTSHDVWQFGIVLFVCLTGCLPWQKAALDDPRYTRYQNWHNATLNIAKKPKLFQLISSRAQRSVSTGGRGNQAPAWLNYHCWNVANDGDIRNWMWLNNEFQKFFQHLYFLWNNSKPLRNYSYFEKLRNLKYLGIIHSSWNPRIYIPTE